MIVRILIIAAVLLFLIFWVRALVDLFTRRYDLTVTAKVLWAVMMLVFPFIGLLVYTMVRPSDHTIAQHARR